jgi:hypothetical protein
MFNLAGLAVLLTAALSVAAVPSHFARHPNNHREIAARVPQPEALPVVEVAARDMSVPNRRMLRRRGPNGRCQPPASSSPVPSPAFSEDPQPSSDPAPPATIPEVKGDLSKPTTTPYDNPQPSTPTPADTPTPTPDDTPTPTPTPSPSPTPTPSDSGNGSNNSGGGGGQTYNGQGTFYSTGLGACGIVNNDGQDIAAVSHEFFDTFAGYDGVNPNNNPMCGKMAVVTYEGKTVIVALTDRCEGCAYGDLDFSPHAFNQIADPSLGRINGISWHIAN